MHIFTFETLESTSTHAKDLLRKGEKTPFAVVAQTQSGGRGRMGRNWQSPKGGLYISIVMPVLSSRPEHAGSHAVVAAMIVSDFLYSNYGVRPKIKWPNDLLWQDKKLVGILGELVDGHVVMGIGINVNTDVDLHDESPQKNSSMTLQATALKDIVSENIDLAALAKKFALYWEESWRPSLFSDLASRFQTYPQVDVWRQGTETLLTKGLDSTGALVTENRDDGNLATHVSVDHGLVPLNSGDLLRHALWLDIGNSYVKLAHATPNGFETQKFSYADYDWHVKLLDYIKLHRKSKSSQFIFGLNVQKNQAQTIEKLLQGEGLRWLRRAPRQVTSRYDAAQLGMDRIALLEGAAAEKSHQYAAQMIVGLGTATTLDVLLSKKHLGGFILPGLLLGAQSLSSLSLLPRLEWADIEKASAELGVHTSAAIANGAVQQCRASILQLQRDLAAEHNIPIAKIRLILTGGGASLMKSVLSDAVVAESLMWRGMAALATL